MTRDEAVTKVGGNRVRAEEIVGALSSLGLLKLDKPLTETERLCAALNWGEHSSRIFNETLAECGLKVVRA